MPNLQQFRTLAKNILNKKLQFWEFFKTLILGLKLGLIENKELCLYKRQQIYQNY